jgi:hypothetical protein
MGDGSPPRNALNQWWDAPELVGGASSMRGTGVYVVDLMRFVPGRDVAEGAVVTDG